MTLASAAPAPSMARARRRDAPPLAVERSNGWLVVRVPRVRTAAAGDIGRPGPWRTIGRPGAAPSAVFELPLAALREVEIDGPDGAAEDELPWLAWARATRPDGGPCESGDGLVPCAPRVGSELPAGPSAALPPADPPSDEELERWLPSALRRVRAGSDVRQVQVVANASRVALVVPDLARLPEDLPTARLAWLAALCHDAQQRWRLVRVALLEDERRVCAEVDLTGAPAGSAERLLPVALSALTATVRRVLPALAVASDPSVGSALLTGPPPG